MLSEAYSDDPKFPGTLHYGMHAHDFPGDLEVRLAFKSI